MLIQMRFWISSSPMLQLLFTSCRPRRSFFQNVNNTSQHLLSCCCKETTYMLLERKPMSDFCRKRGISHSQDPFYLANRSFSISNLDTYINCKLSFSIGCKSRQFSALENSVLQKELASGCCSGADKVYKIIRDNPNPEDKMESALDGECLELTTPMVLDVLHMLQHEEKLAFRFFTWAGLVENYSHEPQAYNMMIDILSSTKYKIRQFKILCDILDYMKRNAKILVPVEVILKILTQYCEKHMTSIQKFAMKKKIKMKKQPEVNALNLLLDALCKCSLVEEAETMLRRVKSKIRPNSDTYNTLFFGWCRVRDPSRGMSILEEMISTGLTPDNFTYNTAIDTFCKSGMIKEALELLDFMKTKGSTISSPTAKTYSIMIVALVKNDRMEECFKLIGDMMTSGCLPDVSTYKEVIESMCLAGKIDAAYKFLEDMGSKGYPPDILSYNCFLKVLCENKDKDNAERLYGKMIDSGCVPSAQSFIMLISMFFEMGDTDGAFDIWSEMDRWGCIRDVNTYCVMIEGLFRCNNPKDACFLLEEVVNMGMQLPYRKVESLLGHLSAVGDLHSIHKLSEHMRQFYNPAMARRFALNQKRKSMSLRGK